MPPLKGTVQKVLQSAQPLLSPEDFDALGKKAEAFLAAEGPSLQRWLWGKWLISSNYITDWCQPAFAPLCARVG